MEEARKFFRYIVPVALYALETTLLLWIVLPDWTGDRIADLKDDNGWGLLIIGIAGSGGLGFLLNTLHHWSNLHLPRLHPPMKYREMIDALRESGTIVLKNSRDKSGVKDWSQNEVQSWSIIAALWHERVGGDSMIQRANPRTDSLANLVHSTGAASVASLAAWVTVLLVVAFRGSSSTQDPILRYAVGFLLGIVFIVLQEWSYRDTLKLTRSFLEQVLTDSLVKEGAPVTTYVSITQSNEAVKEADTLS